MAMQDTARIERGRYTDVVYLQYRGPRWLTIARAVAGVLTWPFVWPLALLCKTSDVVFRTVAEFLSLVPYAIGIVVRAEFYRFALRHCGRNVVVEFGARRTLWQHCQSAMARMQQALRPRRKRQSR